MVSRVMGDDMQVLLPKQELCDYLGDNTEIEKSRTRITMLALRRRRERCDVYCNVGRSDTQRLALQ